MKKTILLFTVLISLFSFFCAVNAEDLNRWEKAANKGVEFLAVGNKPEWSVEIYDKETIKFVNQNGKVQIQAPVDDLWLGPAGEDKIYYVENDVVQFQVIIMKKPYYDEVTENRLPYQVRVVFPNKSYVGGGKLLIKEDSEEKLN